jgi:hypothetical protein
MTQHTSHEIEEKRAYRDVWVGTSTNASSSLVERAVTPVGRHKITTKFRGEEGLLQGKQKILRRKDGQLGRLADC